MYREEMTKQAFPFRSMTFYQGGKNVNAALQRKPGTSKLYHNCAPDLFSYWEYNEVFGLYCQIDLRRLDLN
jgi:hypothetical protein